MYRILLATITLIIFSCDKSPTAPTDCFGSANGTAAVDDCGVCAGGTTGVDANADKDCAGVCGGTATQAYCDYCTSGNFDCAGDCDGHAAEDDCGVCDGDGSTCGDCDGINGSVTVEDECGDCGGDGSECGPPSCLNDCSIFTKSEEEEAAYMATYCGGLTEYEGGCGMCVTVTSIIVEGCHNDCDGEIKQFIEEEYALCQSCPNYILDDCGTCNPCGNGTADCNEWKEQCPDGDSDDYSDDCQSCLGSCSELTHNSEDWCLDTPSSEYGCSDICPGN